MIFPRLAAGTTLLCCALPAARAGLLGRLSSGSPISLRKRLHVNTLITEPGTMEIEWGGAFSTGGNFSFPSAIKYTPEGPYVFLGPHGIQRQLRFALECRAVRRSRHAIQRSHDLGRKLRGA